MIQPISRTARLRRNPDVIGAAVDGDVILLNVANWTHLVFNKTASEIWERLDEPRPFDWIVASLLKDYAVDEVEAQHDIAEFLRELSANGFIVVEGAD